MTSNGQYELPMDRGWAWVCIWACFVHMLIESGGAKSFGVLYTEILEKIESGACAAAWISALNGFFAMALGPGSMILALRYTNRTMVLVGGLLYGVGYILCALAPKLVCLYLAYGVISGIGFGLSYWPALGTVAQYFEKRRGLANAIAVAGNGLGSAVMPLVIRYFLDHFSLQGALIILGGVSLNVCVCGVLMRPTEFYTKPTRKVEEETYIAPDDNNSDHCQKATRAPRNACKETNEAANEKANIIVHRAGSNTSSKTDDTSTPSVCICDSNETTNCKGLNCNKKEAIDTGLKESSHLTPISVSSAFFGLSDPGVAAVQNIFDNVRHTELTLADTRENDEEQIDDEDEDEYEDNTEYEDDNEDKDEYEDDDEDEDEYEDDDEDEDEEEELGCCLVIHQKTCFLPPPGIDGVSKPMFDWSVLGNQLFHVFYWPVLFFSCGYSCVFIMLPTHATESGLTKTQAAVLLSIVGMSDLVGRLTSAHLSDLHVFKKECGFLCAILLSGVSCLLIPFVSTFVGLAVCCGVFGFLGGACVALIAVVFVEVLSPEKMPNIFGLLALGQGFTALVSFPLIGFLRDLTGDWNCSFYFCGILMILGALCVLFEPFAKMKVSESTRRQQHPYFCNLSRGQEVVSEVVSQV